MSLTRIGVMERLTQIDEALEAMTSEQDHPAAAYFKAKRDYEREFAATYLGKEGTVDERKSRTIIALYKAGVYKQLVTAEAAYEAWRGQLKVLETRASIGQSLLRAMAREGDSAGAQPAWSNRQEIAA